MERSWNCDRCQRDQTHIARNCAGRFPKSGVARDGYPISDFLIFECPKTYIKSWALDFIRFVDSTRELGHSLFPSLGELPYKFVSLWQFVETEKSKARLERQHIERLKKQGKN